MSFRSLPPRIADVLDDRDAEARARAIVRRTRRARRRRAPLGALAAAAVLLVSFSALAYRTWGEPHATPTAAPAVGRRSIVLASGRRALGPRSWIEVGPDTDATLLETEDSLEIVLSRGEVTLEVSAEARRVDLDAGLVHLSPIEAALSVERGEDVRVSVRRGRVLARGERVENRARMLATGETLVVRDRSEEARPTPEPAAEHANPTPTREPRPRTTPRAWRELATQGAFDEAWTALDASGVSREVHGAGPEELLVLADVARRSGHAARAEEPLSELLRRFPDDPSAALGAFTLGRLRTDQLGRPADGAEAYERALAGALPATLVPDAWARLALARRAAGQRDRALSAARHYLTRFPDGPRAAEMRALEDAP